MVVCQWLMGPTLFQSSTNLPSCLDALILRDLFFCQKKWGRDELRNCNFSGYHRGMNSWSPWSCYIMIVVLNGVCYIHRGSSENWEAHTMGTILGSVDCLSIVRLLGLPKEITFFFSNLHLCNVQNVKHMCDPTTILVGQYRFLQNGLQLLYTGNHPGPWSLLKYWVVISQLLMEELQYSDWWYPRYPRDVWCKMGWRIIF